MLWSSVLRTRIAPRSSAVAELSADECGRDVALVAIPRSEIHIVVRFGPTARNGLDVYAFGGQERVRRKVIRAGQRTVMALIHLGASEAVLGVPASAIAGCIVELDQLWGVAAAQSLLDRLTNTRTSIEAAAVLDNAIVERVGLAEGRRVHSHLALKAAEKLVDGKVNTVAIDLGVSERHLRRVFRETVGVSPKAFAKLARFHRALGAARDDSCASWASIAAASGYYDQAHLIDEFRTISGVTPRALLGELNRT